MIQITLFNKSQNKSAKSTLTYENKIWIVADADLHGEVDGADLSGDDRSIASDVQDVNDAHLDHDSIDSDREALNLVSTRAANIIYTTQ